MRSRFSSRSVLGRQGGAVAALPRRFRSLAATGECPEAETAAALFSGQLDVADNDLNNAVRRFITLMDIGVLSQERWNASIQEVLVELLAWGAEQEAAARW